MSRQPLLKLMSGPYRRTRVTAIIILLSMVVTAPLLLTSHTSAAILTLRTLRLSDYTAGDSGVNYDFSFTTNTSGPIGSVSFQVCTNYQYEDTDACTPPDGFDASSAALVAQTGPGGFVSAPSGNNNTLLLTRPVALNVASQALSFNFSMLTNPSANGSYYVRIETFSSIDGSGTPVDYGELVFAINQNISITTTVPPYLLFCTGITIDNYDCSTAQGSLVDFGELSTTATRTGTSQLVASTNAPYGYSVTLAGSTMTAGTNVIPAMDGEPSKVGTSQFGINGRSNSDPFVGADPAGPGLTLPSSGYNTPNQFRFNSGDIIASSDNADDYRKLTMSYIVNASADQSPGNYVATISYICLANF
jgi:hypothetical protein